MFNIGDLLRVSSDDRLNGAVGRVESLHPDCDPKEMVYMIKCDEPLKGRGMFPQSQLVYACPKGGDTENDCADCVYAGDFRFDAKTGECVRRE